MLGVDWFVLGTDIFPRFFVIVALLVIAAFRLGVGGAALSILLTAAVAAVASAIGRGPLMIFAPTPIERLFGLQLFLTIGAWTMLPLCEVLRERDALLAQLHERWSVLAESHGALEEKNARVEELIALKESITAALPSRQAFVRNVRSWSDASDLAWRVVETMRLPLVINGVEHAIGASVGASV